MPYPLLDLDAPGIKAEGQLLHTLQKEVATLMERENSRAFPGAQPISFNRKHLEELTRQDYYLCEKSDGMRYLMYCTSDEHGAEILYLIDRRNDFWWVRDLHLPIPKGKQDVPSAWHRLRMICSSEGYNPSSRIFSEADDIDFHRDTIIDGELVIDTLPSGRKQLKYLVFDCICLDKINLMKRTLDKRLAYFREQVFKPYQELFNRYPGELEHQAFIMELKSQQFAYGMEMMFRLELGKLMHGNDGLIFTCRNSEYQPGTDPHILKWKPETQNSVDFRLTLDFQLRQPDEIDRAEGITKPYLDYDSMPKVLNLWTYQGGNGSEDKWYGELFLTEEEWANLKALNQPLNDRIVECVMDEHRRWRFHKFRDDKENGNHFTVVESVITSIRDRVTEQDLIAKAKDIRTEWKRREREMKDRARMGVPNGALPNGNLMAGQKRAAEDQGGMRPSPGTPGQ